MRFVFLFPEKMFHVCTAWKWMVFIPVALEYNLKQVYKLILLLFPVIVVMVVC